jgi:hypothetical protein
MPDARVSPRESSIMKARVVRVGSSCFGVIIGCIMGMTPLLFIDTKRKDRMQKQKELK